MKSTKTSFTNLSFVLLFLILGLEVIKLLGYLPPISMSWLYLFSALIFTITLILHRPNIDTRLLIRQHASFIKLSVLFALITGIFLLTDFLTFYGSPFSIERPSLSPITSKVTLVSSDNTLQRSFTAESDFFGSIIIPFISISSSGELNSPKDSLWEHQFRIQIFNESMNRIIYDNKYNLRWAGLNKVNFPVGFPIEKNSRGKKYQISLSAPISSGSSQLAVPTDSNEFGLIAKYTIPLSDVWSHTSSAKQIFMLKIQSYSSEEVHLVIFTFVLLLVTLFRVWRVKPTFWIMSLSSWIFLVSILICVSLFSEIVAHQDRLNVHLLIKYVSLMVLITTLLVLPQIKSNSSELRKLICKNNYNNWFHNILLIVVILLLLVGSWFRLANLGKDAFYHDELIQYRALLGYLHTGEFGLYNQFTQSNDVPYPRAWLLTYMSSIMAKMGGINESLIRLPTAIAGILILPISFIYTQKLFGKKTALFTLVLITFNPYLIYLSRFFRPYSLIILFFTTTLLSLLWLDRKNYKSRKVVTLNIFILLTSLALTLHFGWVQGLTLLPIIFLVAFIQTTHYINRKLPTFKNKIQKLFLVALVILLIGLFSFLILKYSSILNQITTHISIKIPTWSQLVVNPYIGYLFSINFAVLTIFLSLISFLLHITAKDLQSIKPYLITMYLFVLVAILGNRYEDFRYISFAIPIAMIMISITMRTLWHMGEFSFSHNIYLTKAYLCLLIVLAVFIPIYSIPKQFAVKPVSDLTMPPQYLWESGAGGTYIHRRAEAPDYKTAFDYVNLHTTPQDTILVSGHDFAYLDSNLKNVYYIPRYSKQLESLNNPGNKLSFDTLLKSCNPIWFIGTYLHLLDEDLTTQLMDSEHSISVGSQLSIPQYDYIADGSYKNTTWPSLMYFSNYCSDYEE